MPQNTSMLSDKMMKFDRQSFMKCVNNNFSNGKYEDGLLKNAFKYYMKPENPLGFFQFYQESKSNEKMSDHQLEYLFVNNYQI